MFLRQLLILFFLTLTGLPTAFALPAKGCPELLTKDHPVELLYKKLTATTDWGGKTLPLFFRNRDFKVNIKVNNESYESYPQFVYDLFNNPEEFRNFIIEIYNEASAIQADTTEHSVNRESAAAAIASQTADTTPLFTPTREDLLRVLYARLEKIGFKLQEAPKVLDNVEFHGLIKNGILLLENDPLFLSNQHGHDTHVVQLAYLASKMENTFGAGSTINFYKYMGGKAYYVWSELFDNPNSDDLCNPSMMTRAVRQIGLR